MKKVLAIVLTALIITCAAAGAQAALKAKAEYEGFGLVDLDLDRNVKWTDPQVSVSDAEGNTWDAQIFKYDSDDVDFWVSDLQEDQTYTFNVSGIADGSTVTSEFFASSERSNLIQSVEYDAEDRELDVEFVMDVEYSNPSVTVSDTSGNVYEGRITERDNDSLEVVVKGLSRGSTYTVTVSGVKGYIFDTFESWSREFRAIDD